VGFFAASARRVVRQLRMSVLCVIAAAATGVLPAASAAPGVSAVTVSASPGLSPAFSAAQPDYVVRCDGLTPVELTLTAPSGETVSVNGQTPQGGSFTDALQLAPDQEFTVTVASTGSTRAYYVRCVPADFPASTVSGRGSSSIEGFVAAPSLGDNASDYVILFDAAGVPIWWTRAAGPPIDATMTPTGKIAYELYNGEAFQTDPTQGYQLYNLNGTAAGEVHAVGGPTDTHEFQVDANGDYDLLSYRERHGVDLRSLGGPADGEIVDCVAEIVSPTGQLLWSWDAYDHLGLDQFARASLTAAEVPAGMPDGTTASDIYHCNSMQVDGGEVLLSFRHLDAVYLIDRKSGRIEWKLGGTKTAKSLTVLDDPRKVPFDGQHDARLLPDGTVTVHDNSTFTDKPPRMARYRIDTTKHTATLIQQTADPTVASSACCGSARTLPDGDTLIDWGSTGTIGEYTRTGHAVFRLSFATGSSYRATPVPLGTVNLAQIRAGMNTIAANG
jgi:hypothetical protein